MRANKYSHATGVYYQHSGTCLWPEMHFNVFQSLLLKILKGFSRFNIVHRAQEKIEFVVSQCKALVLYLFVKSNVNRINR